MTVKLSITSIDKIRNEQRRYAKYLAFDGSFEVMLQEVDETSKTASSEPVCVCEVRNKDGQVIIQDRTEQGLYVNGKQIRTSPIQDGDLVWLTDSVHLFFRIYELSGKDLFKSNRSSRDPIVISVVKKEAKERVADYSNPIGQEIGGYLFEDVLEYGTMGIVYKGRQRSLNRPVAIKTISPKNLNNPTMIKRFSNMANLAWRLNHPYIVQIYDTGINREFQMHYVVMEYVEGETLRSVLGREKKLSVEFTCKLMSQLASALSFAHRQNIVHRDVNPTNIIITKDNYLKLVGLALSKVLDPEQEQLNLTMKGQAMGTLGYISPEQARSAAEVDFRTDIYSLGVIFYECLCGKLPYDAQTIKDPVKYMKALRRRPQTAPHDVYSTIPENLSEIVMKCLEPNPEKRYQKAEEVLDDIKVYTETIQLSAAQKRIRAMFPKKPEIEGFDIHITFEPMEEIGGDFYDFVALDDTKWGVVIGDVTGHGIEAAVVMGMIKSIIKLMAKNLEKASDVLEYSNREVHPDMDATTFTTVAYGILNASEKTFHYARAGHNPLILYNPRRDPNLITYTPKGTIMGVPWPLNCEETALSLMPGDVLVQYTDGITETKAPNGEEFGLERLCEVIEQSGTKSADALAASVRQSMADFSKSKADEDDVTLLVIKWKDS